MKSYKSNGFNDDKLPVTIRLAIKKARIIINGNNFKYTDKFINELDKLLHDNVRSEKCWNKFIDKYGQYYISKFEAGGAMYSTIDIPIDKSKVTESIYNVFINHNALLHGFVRTATDKRVPEEIVSIVTMYHEVSMSNVCKESVQIYIHQWIGTRGCIDHHEWEDLLCHQKTLWSLVNVIEVRPFYHLLDNERQTKVKSLIPEQYRVE